MVPDYSSCANSNSEKNPKSVDFRTETEQFLGKSARLSHYHSLNTSQKRLLSPIAPLYGRQWQHYICFKTNAYRLSHPARAAIPPRFVSANTQNIIALTQVNLNFLRGLKSLTPLCSSGAYEHRTYAICHPSSHAAESPPDTTPVNTLITVHLS